MQKQLAGSILFLCSLQTLCSQTTDTLTRNPFLLGARFHYGFIIPHSRELIDVSHSKPYGFEISAQWLLAGEKYTRNSGVIAKRGFVLHYFNYDNPGVLGQGVTLVPFVEPMIRPWRRLYGSVQLGLGVVYLNTVYDKETNPTNLFFSFPVSMLAMTNFYLFYKANPHWHISLGFNYNHISNGGMKLPNKGMNFPTYNAGFTYNFHPLEIPRPVKSDDWKKKQRNFAYLLPVATLKTAEATEQFPENKICWQLGGMAMAGRQVGRLSALSAGTEWIYDGYAREILDREGKGKSAWKGGLLFGHELLVSRVRFSVHLGAYVYNPSRNTDAVYQRYGLYYRAGKHILFGSTMKAHRHVADVFDMRLGWIW